MPSNKSVISRFSLGLSFVLGAAISYNALAGDTAITVGDASATVTGSGGAVLTFPVTRTGDRSYAAFLGYQLMDGSAVAGKDYVAAAGALRVSSASTTLSVKIPGSTSQGSDKTFTLRLLDAGKRASSIVQVDANNADVVNLSGKAGGVVAADVNGDGYADLVTSDFQHNTVSVWLNSTTQGAASASYGSASTFAVGHGPSGLAMADVNEDGLPDVIVANKADNTVSVLLNTTQPLATQATLSGQQTFAAGTSPQSVTAADINGDGRPDLIIGDLSGNAFSVLINVTAPGASSASFSSPQGFSAGAAVAGYAIAVADLNMDGSPDVVLVNNTNSVWVLLNTTQQESATAIFAAAQSFVTGNGAGAIKVADANNDGKPDLITANYTDSTVSVLLNTTTPGALTVSYAAQQVFSSAFTTGTLFESYDVGVADIDGDGFPDLIVTQNSPNKPMMVGAFINATGAGSMSMTLHFNGSPFYMNAPATGDESVGYIAIADVNLDGVPDVITIDQTRQNATVLVSDLMSGGAGATFFATQDFATGNNPAGLHVIDVNTDAKPDLVTVTTATRNVSVLLNTTTTGANAASFTAETTFISGGSGVVAGDLNRDNKPDLASADLTDNKVFVLRNTTAQGATTPSFAARQGFTLTSGPSAVAIADVNRDGNQDLRTIDHDGYQVIDLLNTTAVGSSTFSFTQAAGITVGSGFLKPSGESVADINGDGISDLAVQALTKVYVLLNNWPSNPVQLLDGDPFISGGSVIADVNGDNKPDRIIIVGAQGLGYVSLNTTPTGSAVATFAAPQAFTIAKIPVIVGSISIADMDGDGRPDILLASKQDTPVTLLINATVPGSTMPMFVPGGTIPTDETSGVNDIAAFDINADGRTDLVFSGDGTHIGARINSVNAAATISSYTAAGTIHFDIIPPTLTVTGPAAVIVNSAHQSYFGSLSAAGNLCVSVNGAACVDVPLNSDYSFSCYPPLVEGANTITFKAMASTGIKTSVTKTITVDTTPPVAPNSGLIITTVVDGVFTITGSAGSVEPSSQITILDVTTGISITITADATGAFTTTLSGASEGDQLTISDADSVGNTSSGTGVPVDTIAPTIMVTSPTSLYTNQTSITVAGSLDEAGTLTIDGNNVSVSQGSWSFNYNLLLPQDGSHNISLVATDLAHNSHTVTRSIIRDRASPTLSITSPTGPYVTQSSFPIVLSYADVGVGIDPSTVSVTDNGATLSVACQPNSDGSGASCTPSSGLPDGPHVLLATVKDLAGNSPLLPATLNLTVDSNPPVITLSGSHYAGLSNPSDAPISGRLNKHGILTATPTDSAGNPQGPSESPETFLELDGTYSFNYDGALGSTDGEDYYFKFVMQDDLGVSITQTWVVHRDIENPGITVTSPDADYSYTNKKQVAVAGLVTEAGTVLVDSGSRSSTITVGDDLSFSGIVELRETGENHLFFEALDRAGNNSSSVEKIVYLDTVAPSLDATLISGTDLGAGQGTRIDGLAGAVTDNADNGVSSLTIAGVGNGPGESVVFGTDGAFTKTLTAPATDPFVFTAADLAGNSTSMRIQFGAACYTDASTRNTSLAVGDATGVVLGQQDVTMNFPITRTGEMGFDTYLDYKTRSDGPGDDAVDGLDYVGDTRSLLIPAGTTHVDLPITVKGKSDNPPSDKHFTLQILGVHNFTAGTFDLVGNDSHSIQTNANDHPSPTQGVAVDLNKDGKPDLVTVNAADDTISILLNTTVDGAQQDTFAYPQVISVPNGPISVAAVDIDQDTKPDLAITYAGTSGSGIVLLLNATQTEDTTATLVPALSISMDSKPDYIVAADLNEDGKPDLLVSTETPDAQDPASVDGALSVYLNTSQGAGAFSFADPQPFGMGIGSIYSMAVAVLGRNPQSLPDVVTANADDGSITVLVNNSTAGSMTLNFTAEQPIPVGDFAIGLAIGDFNDDQLMDIAVVAKDDPNVEVIANTTALGATMPSFAPPLPFPVGQGATSVAAVDIDSDTKADLVVSNGDDGTLLVLHNVTASSSNTNFITLPAYQTGTNSVTALAADLNHDQKPDVVTVDQDSDTVSIFMNTLLGSCVTPANVTGTIHYDVVKPVITLTSPTATTFESPYQVLSGHVSAAVTLVVIDPVTGAGAPLQLAAGQAFNLNITLHPGTYTYTLQATDTYGNLGTLPLVLTLNNPSLPAPVATAISFESSGCGLVTLVGGTGAAYPGSTITITDLTTGRSSNSTVDPATGAFSVSLSGVGECLGNSFSVYVSDGSGHQSPIIYLNGSDHTLKLTVTSPCSSDPGNDTCDSGVTVDSDTVNIAGTYDGPIDIGIMVDGVPAHLDNGHFYLNNVPLQVGVTNTINVIATTAGGLWTAQTLVVTSTSPSILVLSASPSDTGVAPFTVGFSYRYQGNATIQSLRMSFGDGSDDLMSSDPSAALSHTYVDPGTYLATLTLTDSNGADHVATLQVTAQDPSAVDAVIKRTWSFFTAALARGDRAAAMNYLDSTAQKTYGPVFDTLLSRLPQIAGSVSQILQSRIDGDVAEYAVVRDQGGQSNLYFVYFIRDSDGVWRIESM